MGVFVAKASEKKCSLCGGKVDVMRVTVASKDSMCQPVDLAVCPKCDLLTRRKGR